MTMISNLLVVVATAATLGATASSAFAGYNESYQPSYQSSDYSYNDHGYSSDRDYRNWYGWGYYFDRDRGYSDYRGHDRRR